MLPHPANRTHNPQLYTRPTTCKPKRQVPQVATICVTLELLMMGIMVPETCRADNKFCNKNHPSVASSWSFILHVFSSDIACLFASFLACLLFSVAYCPHCPSRLCYYTIAFSLFPNQLELETAAFSSDTLNYRAV